MQKSLIIKHVIKICTCELHMFIIQNTDYKFEKQLQHRVIRNIKSKYHSRQFILQVRDEEYR